MKILKKLLKSIAIIAVILMTAIPQLSYADYIFINATILQTPGTFKVASGTYVGTGASLPVVVGFQPDWIIIKANGIATEDDPIIQGGSMSSKIAPANVNGAAFVTFTGTGFTSSVNAQTNALGTTYYYFAMTGSSAELSIGSYTGDGLAGHAIATPGFQPDLLFIKRSGTTTNVVLRTGVMPTDSGFELGGTAGLVTNRVTSLTSTGFTVGTAGNVNTSGATYYYIAVKVPSSAGDCGSFTGNSTDNTDITIPSGVQPEWVYIKGNTTVESVMRGTANISDDTSRLSNSAANANNRVQVLNSNGFQVGTNGEVNSSATTYYYCALKDA